MPDQHEPPTIPHPAQHHTRWLSELYDLATIYDTRASQALRRAYWSNDPTTADAWALVAGTWARLATAHRDTADTLPR